MIPRRFCGDSSSTPGRSTCHRRRCRPPLEQGARTLIVERGPWEATIPLDELSAASFPTLVVSGSHHAAFEAICDVLVARLAAERLVLPGYGHSVQRHPEFNEQLADFVVRAET